MKFEHATAAVAAVQQVAHSITVPDPIKQAAYATGAAIIGWAVGAILSWLAKRLGVKTSG